MSELHMFNINNSTPLDALNKINDWKKRYSDEIKSAEK